MFQPADGSPNFPQLEEDVLRFWKEHSVYHRSLERRAGAEPFVFYEGPPTANGMPHPGHCLTRAIKDVFPRYKTMRGYRCERKAGWDTHGLPVEVEVCKELGIHSKEEIEAYGIEPFIQKCQASVWRYMQEWQRLTERLGFWVDLDQAYVTYHQSYVESVWWSLKQLFDRGLLYQGHKIVWWWAQGGTALSAGEVGQGYRQVADPSVYVKFPEVNAKGEERPVSLLVWTTTPWTLPSNQFVAINPEVEYVTVADPDDKSRSLLVAADLVDTLSEKCKHELTVQSRVGLGCSLLGTWYRPPFDCFTGKASTEPRDSWRIVPASFVSTESGTGLVHIAPAFGEDDYAVLMEEQSTNGSTATLINCVAPDGKFTDEAPEFVRGRWVKDCDKDIIRDLKQRGLLFHQEQYLHDYPFCWRAEEDPLIQYPRESWFIRTTAFKDAMLQNNQQINWLPEHIKGGRMGKFLESNVDWALSRERYWGTPLPIWQCTSCQRQSAVGGYDELLAQPGVTGTEVWDEAKRKNPELPDDLRVHKPYIDAVTFDCTECGQGRMQRVTEVIDCWYDSGAMPFAQWGYRGESNNPPPPGGEGLGEGGGPASGSTEANPGTQGAPHPGPPHQGEGETRDSVAKFHSQFPADFISEAIDQTRGWFYSQLAISTMLWGQEPSAESNEPTANSQQPTAYPHPFKNCIVLGLMLGEDGQKMSKSKRNYREPNEIFNRYGADALRWYLFANQPPWTSIRYSEQAIKDSIPEFLLRLWNCYSFFVIYANIDGFDPTHEVAGEAGGCPPPLDGEARFSDERGEGCSPASGSIAAKPGTQGAPLPNPPHEGEGISQLTPAELAHAATYRPLADRGELDRWVLSELHRTTALVTERMDAYDNYGACEAITTFVDALSNWWVRRSRDRFWAKDKRSTEKLDAYWTLYECLVTTSKLIAPFTPFIAETFWQNLAGVFSEPGAFSEPEASAPGASEFPLSVHLCDYPAADPAVIDEALSERMEQVRLISSLGRRAREAAGLKVRQPLSRVEVVLADNTHQAWLEEHAGVIQDELNVQAVEYSDNPETYVDHEVLPNFKLLGKKLGKLMPQVKFALNQASGSELLANLRDNGMINLTVDGQAIELSPEEVEVRITAKQGWAAANDRGVVVVLATELTDELIAEGLAQDLKRAIQDRRKEIGCEFTDRIEIGVETDAELVIKAVEQHQKYLAGETLADKLVLEKLTGVEAIDLTLGDHPAKLYIKRLS